MNYSEIEARLKSITEVVEFLNNEELKLREMLKTYQWTDWEILGPWYYDPNFDMGYDEAPCLVFYGGFFIELKDDCYYLLIESDDYEDENLSDLVHHLAEFKLQCGLEPWALEHPIAYSQNLGKF